MKFLGVDHGNRRIGIAISDPDGKFARPLEIIQHVSRAIDAQEVLAIALENECEAILVGLPLDSEGKVGPRARSVNRFVEELRSIAAISVYTWDETNSTKEVLQASILRGEKQKKRRAPMDHHAAALILQDYLDNYCHEVENE